MVASGAKGKQRKTRPTKLSLSTISRAMSTSERIHAVAVAREYTYRRAGIDT